MKRPVVWWKDTELLGELAAVCGGNRLLRKVGARLPNYSNLIHYFHPVVLCHEV